MKGRAARFKRAYKPTWHLSNQKEYFIATYLRSLGYTVKFIGLGAGSEKLIHATGSPPDLAVYLHGKLIAYVEVTGANFLPAYSQYIYITRDKFEKYYSYAQQAWVIFTYLGFRSGKLAFAGWASYEDLYPYAERNIVTKYTAAGPEQFIETPARLWKPLWTLGSKLLELFPTEIVQIDLHIR